MFPGAGNPRQMKQMMKQLGIDMEQLDGVEEVVIKTGDSELVFSAPQVTVMDAKGQKIYQVVGNPEEQEVGYEPEEEDLELVIEQTGASEEDARAALEEADGDMADAILELEEG